MASFKYTADQQMALDFPGNVIVSAGAGSGKTRVLVEKYFRLLVDEHPQWPVESVVAITFTRKAASELKSRILKRVMDELELDDLGAERKTRLLQVRADLGAAPIGTIHTFCGRILKEFAFDAHLNPDFAIVEGARESTLRMDAARQTVAEATAEKGSEMYQSLLALLNVLSPSGLHALLAGMLAGRTNYLVPAQKYVEHSVDELFADLHDMHAEYVVGVREELAEDWVAVLRELERRCNPGKVRELAAMALAHWPADPAVEWQSCEELLQAVMEGALTKTGKCRKVEFKKAEIDEDDPLRERLESIADKYQKSCIGDLTVEDRRDLELSRHLARLFLRAAELYGVLRGGGLEEDEVQLLDYADLEILAEKMVTESSRIRRLLKERYRFLIIDEFQDTSEQQWKIVRALCTDDNGEALPGRLFVVGDRKQGVYGFRDANVQLFTQVHEMITTRNDDWMGNRGGVTMAANFRTLEKPLSLINQVFQRVLTSIDNEYAVDFEPLELTQTAKPGCVEYLYVEPDMDEQTGKPVKTAVDERRGQEAELVAAHAAELIASGAVQPGDIAILTRKRAVFTPFEEALEAHGIPVVTQQGLNMFHQPELADAVAALNAVVYSHRDLVFAHYLRSPAIGLTDDLLLKIARTPGRSYYDKAVRVAAENKYRLDDLWFDLDDAEKERLTFALDTLNTARELVGMKPPYDVVNYVVNRLNLRLIARASFRGEQAVANLDKLLDVARSAEFISYEDFLEYIESEEQNERGMAEVRDLTTVDAVKIMTIHAAKGLEFPVVYLPDLNSGVGGRAGQVDGDGIDWMTFRLSTEMRGDSPVFLSEYFKERAEQQSLAEERRVFYVAMTRCKHHLVLCASEGRNFGKSCFYEMVKDEFDAAQSAKKLLTQNDFTEQQLRPLPSDDTNNSRPLGLSRTARLEGALRAASVLADNRVERGS